MKVLITVVATVFALSSVAFAGHHGGHKGKKHKGHHHGAKKEKAAPAMPEGAPEAPAPKTE